MPRGQHLTPDHQRRAYLAQQRKIHEAKRHDTRLCSRSELLLRLAIDKLGWTVVQYEYELDGRWYNVAAWVDGELMLVDLLEGRVTDKQKRNADDHGVRLVQVRPGSTADIIGQIEIERMTKGA